MRGREALRGHGASQERWAFRELGVLKLEATLGHNGAMLPRNTTGVAQHKRVVF